MADYSEVLLDLNPLMIRKLGDNKVVQLKGGMIGTGMKVKVPTHMAKRLHRAQRLNKGVRLHMTPEDIEMNGGKINWGKVGRTIKRGLQKGWKGYKKYVKPTLGPLIRQGLKAVGDATLAANPEFLWAEPLVSPAINVVGDITGAYGMKKKRGGRPKATRGGSFIASNAPSASPGMSGGRVMGTTGRTILERGASANVLAGPALPAPLVGVSPAMYPVIDYGNMQFGSDYISSFM